MPPKKAVASSRLARGEGAGPYTLWQLDAKLRPRQHCTSHCQLHHLFLSHYNVMRHT